MEKKKSKLDSVPTKSATKLKLPILFYWKSENLQKTVFKITQIDSKI